MAKKNQTILNIQHKINTPIIKLIAIYLTGVILFGILILLVSRTTASDDFAFQTQIIPYGNVFEWTIHRYNTWSGRIFAESFVYIFSPLPLYYWKIITVALFALFSAFIFFYYTLIAANRSHLKDQFMMIASVLLLLLVPTRVITDSTLWVTGAMNYFWLATFALVAFYPIVYYTRYKKPAHWFLGLSAAISGIIAASSQEQLGAVLVTLGILFLVRYIYTVRKIPVAILVLCILFILSFISGIIAPGNDNRAQLETISRIPDFNTTPFFDHLNYAYRWLLDSYFNSMGTLFAIFWVLLLGAFNLKRQEKSYDKVDSIIISILIISVLFMALKSTEAFGFWFNFYATWHANPPLQSYVVLIAWSVSIAATIFSPMAIWRKDSKAALLTIIVCAAVASAAVITLSPTMYASGPRTLFVPSLLLLIASFILFEKAYSSLGKHRLIYLVSIFSLAASQYLFLLKFLLSK